MAAPRSKIRIVVWVGAALYLGLRLLLLGGSAMFGGPGEPGSSMTFQEFHLRSAAGQWLRDDIDSFIVALTFCIAASIIVTLATLRWKAPNRRTTCFWGFVRIAGICLCVAACVFIWARLGGPSSCEGNTAALAACKTVVTRLDMVSQDWTNAPVSVADIDSWENQHIKFGSLPGLEFLPHAKILVRSTPISFSGAGSHEIVAVCDTPFDNVPRRVFGKAPMTHAVSYSDWTSTLIPVEEFERLDLSGFIDVKTLRKQQPGGIR